MEPGQSFVCPACHEPLREGAAFCHRCGAPVPSQIILKAIDFMSSYSSIAWQETDSGLEVEASSPEGFPIIVDSSDTETILYFGGWHDHFTDPIEAFDWFRKAIMGQVRLAVTSRFGISYRWDVQELNPTGAWTIRHMAALLIPIPLPYKRVQYLLNRFTRAA